MGTQVNMSNLDSREKSLNKARKDSMEKSIVKSTAGTVICYTAGKDFEEEYKTMQNIIQARHEKSYFSPVANVCGRFSK